MSTTFNETGQANPPPGELSEADRAAWLRIERALRGMRWWMLLLALIMPAVGLTISSGACIELFVDGVGIVSYWYFFITFFGVLGISGIALASTGVLFAWSFLAIRRVGWLQDSTKIARFLTRYRRAWISLCFSVGLAAVAIVALLVAVFSRFYLEI
jgi:hypothetical protein